MFIKPPIFKNNYLHQEVLIEYQLKSYYLREYNKTNLTVIQFIKPETTFTNSKVNSLGNESIIQANEVIDTITREKSGYNFK